MPDKRWTMDQNVLPFVTVIMPVYNAEKFIDESVGSILAQTFGDFELVCFNDASTDGSLDRLKYFSSVDNRVRILDSPVNVKQGGGRNRALRVARGNYVMFVDADDMLRVDAIEQCMAAVRDHGADAVFFDYERFSSSTGWHETVSQLGDDASGLTGDDLRRRIIARTAPVWCAMYRKSLITDNGLYFPENVFYEDNAVALAMQLVARNPVKINATLYRYRFDNVSVTRSVNDPRFFDRIGSAVTLLGHMKRLGIYGRFADEIDFLFVNQYLVHTVFGAIYRFDRVQVDRIREVVSDVETYVPRYNGNLYYKAQPMSMKIKIWTHIHVPRLVKMLSNINRRLRVFGRRGSRS